MTAQQALEKPFSGGSITSSLQIHINDFAILINRTPQILLLAVYFYEDFINVESITVASVLPLQVVGINSSELDTPKSYSFAADSDTPFS